MRKSLDDTIHLLLHLCFCFCIGLCFCLFPIYGTSSAQERPRVAAILVEEDMLFWSEVWEGIRSSAQENDILLSEYPFSHLESSDITGLVDTAIFAQVDGIILRSQDVPSDSLSTSLKVAREQGIYVVTVDVDSSERDVFCGIDNDAAAALIADEAMRILSPGERIAIIKSDASISTVDARNRAFLEALQREYDVECDVYVYPNPGNTAVGTITEYLEANPDIRIIFAGGPMPLQSSAVAITRMNQDREFTLLGFYEKESFLQEITGEKLDMRLIKQDPFSIGEHAMDAMTSLLKGEILEEDTYLLPVTLLSGDEIR